jgi:hypothetical protein
VYNRSHSCSICCLFSGWITPAVEYIIFWGVSTSHISVQEIVTWSKVSHHGMRNFETDIRLWYSNTPLRKTCSIIRVAIYWGSLRDIAFKSSWFFNSIDCAFLILLLPERFSTLEVQVFWQLLQEWMPWFSLNWNETRMGLSLILEGNHGYSFRLHPLEILLYMIDIAP